LERYRRVQQLIHSTDPIDVDAAQQRVWKALQSRLPLDSSLEENPVNNNVRNINEHWWQRSFKVPLPAVAAAAMVLMVVGIVLRPDSPSAVQMVSERIRPLTEFRTTPEMFVSPAGFPLQQTVGRTQVAGQQFSSINFGSDMQLRVEADSIGRLVQLLANQNLVRDITISLPQDQQMPLFSEPVSLPVSGSRE
ncbi:MAG: hypothetical protein D6B26_04065, partial [Spirochaetaceae bacterium]